MTDRLKEIEARHKADAPWFSESNVELDGCYDMAHEDRAYLLSLFKRRAEGDGAEIVRELRAPEEGWSGNAECVSAEVAARAADYIEAMGGVPAGWVLVPVEPTPEMLSEGRKYATYWDEGDPAECAVETYAAMLAASPTPPTADNGWRRMDTAPRVEGEPVLLLSRIHGVVEAWWAPGEWSSEIPGISPREYSGPVWVCGDDAWQIEVEETPSGYLDGDAIGWLPRNALPTPPTESNPT